MNKKPATGTIINFAWGTLVTFGKSDLKFMRKIISNKKKLSNNSAKIFVACFFKLNIVFCPTIIHKKLDLSFQSCLR